MTSNICIVLGLGMNGLCCTPPYALMVCIGAASPVLYIEE